MSRWWLRPLVRFCVALLLPFGVPAVISYLIWAMPGDPASIICAPEVCVNSYDALAERWNLDRGPWHFYSEWASAALGGDFGKSWTYMPSESVGNLLLESLPNTLKLVGLATLILLLGSVRTATGQVSAISRRLIRALGAMPALVLALVGAASLSVTFGAMSTGNLANTVRLLIGAGVLAVADASLSGTMEAVGQVVGSEKRQRYVHMGLLRGEGTLENMLPNILPALAGQFRAKVLALLSSAVIIEVILSVEGVGELLWNGTLDQDFGLVLGATFVFVLISSALMLMQAVVEVMVGMMVRRTPVGVVE